MTELRQRVAPEWPLATDRLLLRPFEPGDLDALYEMQSDEKVVRYLYFGTRTREEVRDPLAEGQGELGFVIHPAHHGRGYAVEASIPLLDFAVHTLELHRVVGRAEARNAPSLRVLEKVGMRHEAHLVENEWVKGEWQSEVVYAILANEWASRGDR